MWADTLLALERGHLLRLAIWASASMLVGIALLLTFAAKARATPLLRGFAIQTAAWGLVDLVICAWGWRGLALRDFRGALDLVNFLWLNLGLDAAYVAVGVTLAVAARTFGRRAGPMGAGMGIVVQGVALLWLDVRLVVLIGPVG